MTCDCHRIVVAFQLDTRPVPKGRPRFGKTHAYTDPKTRTYENQVRAACTKAMNGAPAAAGDVELLCLFEQTNSVLADTDNLTKAVSDAIEGSAFVNDRQVVQIRARRIAKADTNRVSVAVLEVHP